MCARGDAQCVCDRCVLAQGRPLQLKSSVQGQVLGKEVQHMLLDRGTLGIDALLAAVQNQDYAVLPAHLGQVARQLDARIEGGFGNVREIECMLDAACFADMADYARRSGQQVVVQCVQVQADLLNLITLLRIKRSQAGPEQLAGALLPAEACRTRCTCRPWASAKMHCCSISG